ncbi:prepilin peptidase, partial [Lactobacillus crispatus]
GSCLASHAAVVYERWDNKNFIYSRSQCNNCHFELSILDEVPLLSYLFLHGKCRYCHQIIPAELFLFELIGGFAFCSIDFSNLYEIPTIILLFFLLTVAISDYQEQEFDLLFLIPAFSIALIFNQFAIFSIIDWLSFFLLLTVFAYYIWQKKMGLGDLLIYLVTACYFTPSFANFAFLFASIFMVLIFLFEKSSLNQRHPFIPYIFLGIILTQFIF